MLIKLNRAQLLELLNMDGTVKGLICIPQFKIVGSMDNFDDILLELRDPRERREFVAPWSPATDVEYPIRILWIYYNIFTMKVCEQVAMQVTSLRVSPHMAYSHPFQMNTGVHLPILR